MRLRISFLVVLSFILCLHVSDLRTPRDGATSLQPDSITEVFPGFKDIVPLEECFEAAGVALCGRLLCQVAFAALFFFYHGQLFRL